MWLKEKSTVNDDISAFIRISVIGAHRPKASHHTLARAHPSPAKRKAKLSKAKPAQNNKAWNT